MKKVNHSIFAFFALTAFHSALGDPITIESNNDGIKSALESSFGGAKSVADSLNSTANGTANKIDGAALKSIDGFKSGAALDMAKKKDDMNALANNLANNPTQPTFGITGVNGGQIYQASNPFVVNRVRLYTNGPGVPIVLNGSPNQPPEGLTNNFAKLGGQGVNLAGASISTGKVACKVGNSSETKCIQNGTINAASYDLADGAINWKSIARSVSHAFTYPGQKTVFYSEQDPMYPNDPTKTITYSKVEPCTSTETVMVTPFYAAVSAYDCATDRITNTSSAFQ